VIARGVIAEEFMIVRRSLIRRRIATLTGIIFFPADVLIPLIQKDEVR
jgi:hypothetical protein